VLVLKSYTQFFYGYSSDCNYLHSPWVEVLYNMLRSNAVWCRHFLQSCTEGSQVSLKTPQALTHL